MPLTEPTLANAIMNRLAGNIHGSELKEKSLGKRRSEKKEYIYRSNPPLKRVAKFEPEGWLSLAWNNHSCANIFTTALRKAEKQEKKIRSTITILKCIYSKLV